MIFRRERTQVFNEGGLWDESGELYPMFGARSNRNEATYTFPSGAKIGFDHLQREHDVQAHQGAQIALIAYDELNHFLASQFWYMFSRNRSLSGVRPYIRASVNPDPDSWVADLIEWWIDQEQFLEDGVTPNPGYGFPLPERAGVLRHFLRVEGELIWGDTPGDVLARLPEGAHDLEDVKSLTFIPAKLDDNQILMRKDRSYRGNLRLLDPVMQARLLGGNWKAKAAAGVLFQRGWVEFVTVVPRAARRIRYWDRAATPVTDDSPDPDWTVGVLLALTEDGLVWIEDVVRLRGTPLQVEQLITATAALDAEMYGLEVTIGIEQDPGSAGKSDAAHYLRLLAGYRVTVYRPTKQKVVRFGPFSAQAQGGNVRIKKGAWNHVYVNMLEKFPSPGIHDDDPDATGGGYNALVNMPALDEPEDLAATAAAQITLDML